MRKTSLYVVAAALLVATSGAHASFFPGSSLTVKDDSDDYDRGFPSIVKVGLLEDITDWVEHFHAEGAVAGSDASSDDAANQNGCTEDAKTAAKKTDKKPSKGTDQEDEDKPTGPEPIYFGF